VGADAVAERLQNVTSGAGLPTDGRAGRDYCAVAPETMSELAASDDDDDALGMLNTAPIQCLQCLDAVGWAAGRASGL